MMVEEVKEHLLHTIIPFWKNLRDNEHGGYYGWLGYDLALDKKAVKGCILNSRITWFFANAYTLLKDESLLDEAKHGFAFMKDYCFDKENGGIYWSITYDGKPEDTTKHTYNQAFCIYALSSYYEASKDEEALAMAKELFHIIEEKCTDEVGYLEAFDREFHLIENDKLSENGVIADKTMNTLLHVFEAYTELYRVSKDTEVKKRLEWILDTIADKIYNPKLHRQEVFFDKNYNSILDLHSYGHDIETAWLLNRGVDVLGEEAYQKKMGPIIDDLTAQVYKVAFDGHSLANECEKGVVNTHRVWWVQAETVIGFLNGYQRNPEKKEYLEAAKSEWQFIKDYVIDKREGSEWFWEVDENGKPYPDRPIVEPWKCPYHNGRMCIEVIRRDIDVA
ncbi:AGE family epimerase/isomerase [Roseburia sp. BX0805]|uniref:Cellobiose 2-epimerase n=1 Tax=Roseburia yibonii TaxID=2763063 RepID=A0ABR7IBM6_9FIRM|nr:AGE family epimerase/isomerase [Roseburia yibonii]MBC5754340.1 AGE family epimerase/isomerase [Roseburia yibonii]